MSQLCSTFAELAAYGCLQIGRSKTTAEGLQIDNVFIRIFATVRRDSEGQQDAHGIQLGLVELVKTRRSSYVGSLSSVLVNKLPLQQAIVTPKIASVIDAPLRIQLLSESTFAAIDDMLDPLNPVRNLLRLLRRTPAMLQRC